jgi:hypothetical protein
MTSNGKSRLIVALLVGLDPAVAEAMACFYRYRNEYFGEIPVLRFAYDFISGKDLTAGFAPRKTQVRQGMLYRGMYLRAQTTLGCAYGELSPDFAWYAASVVHDVATAMEMYFDDAPWPYGMYLFDIQAPPVFVQATGKLDRYASAGKLFLAPGEYSFLPWGQQCCRLLESTRTYGRSHTGTGTDSQRRSTNTGSRSGTIAA